MRQGNRQESYTETSRQAIVIVVVIRDLSFLPTSPQPSLLITLPVSMAALHIHLAVVAQGDLRDWSVFCFYDHSSTFADSSCHQTTQDHQPNCPAVSGPQVSGPASVWNVSVVKIYTLLGKCYPLEQTVYYKICFCRQRSFTSPTKH